MSDYNIILCTTSAKEEAEIISKQLVKKRLAACVSILEGLTSIFEWESQVCTENECLMIIKSTKVLFDNVKETITSLHSYDVPEIISIDIENGLETYLSWINKNTAHKI